MGMTRANAADWKAQPAGAEDACRVGEASAKYKAAASGYLPFGLKQTEVGIIPNDWEVKSMGAIGSLSKGRGLLKEDIRPNGSVPAVPYTALYTDFSEVLDYKRIKWFVDETEGTVVVDEPCVLIASSSNMAENTGKASAPPGHMPIAVGREVIIFRSGDSATFISYLLSTASYRKRTLALARGTTIKHLYPATFADYKLGLPALREQRVIAEALSDVDGLLEDLDALIAKKRAIRQAAMQQLLTGKTRLPGFSGRWYTKCLGELVTFLSGGTPSRGVSAYWHGEIPWISASSLRTFYVWRSDTNLSKAGVAAGSRMAPVGATLLLVRGSALHNEILAGLVTKPVCFNQDVKALVPNSSLVPEFLTFCLHGRADELLRLVSSAGNTAGVLDTKILKAFEILLPDKREQEAISAALADIDAEIVSIEARRDKTRAIKQGMMQQLLTGRVRLVSPATEESH